MMARRRELWVAAAVMIAARAAAEPTDWPQSKRPIVIHDGSDAEPEPPPLPAFANPTTFQLVRLDADGMPHCEAWTTAPGSAANLGQLEHGELGVPYHSAGLRLDACNLHALVRDIGSGADAELDVDGARWFATARACNAAIAKRRAVATDFDTCLPAPPAPAKAVAATRALFATILLHGGDLSVRGGSDCGIAHATPSPDGYESKLRISYPDDVRELDYSYDADSNRLTTANDHALTTGSDTGGHFGCICADVYTPEFGDGTIDAGDHFYLTIAKCKTSVAVDRRRAAWVPMSEGSL